MSRALVLLWAGYTVMPIRVRDLQVRLRFPSKTPVPMAQIGASQNDKAAKKVKEELSTPSKVKVDFGPILEASIPQNRDLALKEGKPAEAIENLLGVCNSQACLRT